MPDTQRTLAALQSLLADNVAHEISPQDVRDFLVSVYTQAGPSILVAASDAPTMVKNRADYVCDGTADDVQINAAIAASPAAGGIVQLSGGTFAIAATINMTTGITLEGVGKATVLQLAASADVDVINIPDATFDMTIRDLYIDGNRDNNTLGTAISFASRAAFADLRTLIDHVTIANMDENGIETLSAQCQNLHIRSSFVTSCDNYCLYSLGVDLQATDCLFGLNVSGDLALVTGDFSALVNCLFFVSAAAGLVLYGAEGATVVGCSFDRNGGSGIYIGSTPNGIKIIGCHLHTNSQNTDNTYSHITVGDNNVLDINIIGCTFHAKASGYTNDAQYCVNFAGGTGIRANGFATNVAESGSSQTGYTNSIGQWIDGFADGATSVADGGTIAHGMTIAPTVVQASPSVAGEMVSVTTIDATNITVALKTHAGAAGTTQTVYWRAYA